MKFKIIFISTCLIVGGALTGLILSGGVGLWAMILIFACGYGAGAMAVATFASCGWHKTKIGNWMRIKANLKNSKYGKYK